MEDNARLELELTDVSKSESQISTASERELNA
jgi:hypothetical protein